MTLTPVMRESLKNMSDLKKDLQDCETLNEMWGALGDHYDLDRPLRPIAKAITIKAFMSRVTQLMTATGTKKKEHA